MFHNYSLDKRVIPIGLVLRLTQTMVQRGHSVHAVLQHTSILESDLQVTENRVTYRQRIQVIRNVLRLLDDPGVWLEWETETSISDFGLLGYAMMSSATLEQAVQIAVKYHKMAGAMFELIFIRDGADAVLRLDHLLAGGEVDQYLVEELFRGITPLIALLIGKPFRPRQICFSYEPATSLHRYQNCFQCNVGFSRPFCEYRFDAGLLDQRLAEADSRTAKSCEAACRTLLNHMEIEEDLVSRICHLLLSKPGDFPRLDAAASRLSIGSRTLRRRLKDLGTSYQAILDDVKKELAIEYLQNTNLSVQEISELLGYSEVTNFRRAFVKWATVSPHQYRRQHGLAGSERTGALLR